MTSPLIFPVGHYLGATYSATEAGDGENARPENQIIRVEWQLRRLGRPEQMALWALAHGVPDGDGTPPWTRAAADGAARGGGIRDTAALFDELTEMDLLVEVEPGTQDAVDFARVYRLHSLLTGLGESVDQLGRYGIGLAGQPVVRVDGFTYQFWQWAPACDNLWHACEIFARADGSDVLGIVARMLPALQVLISHGAAYLDEAVDEWDRPGAGLDDVSTSAD